MSLPTERVDLPEFGADAYVIVRGLTAGQRDLLSRHSHLIGVLASRHADYETARDIATDVLVQLARSFDEGRGKGGANGAGGSFAPYAIHFGRRIVADRLGKRRARSVRLLPFSGLTHEGEAIAADVADLRASPPYARLLRQDEIDEAKRGADLVLARVGQKGALALRLFYLEGLTHREAGARCGLTPEGAACRVTAALSEARTTGRHGRLLARLPRPEAPEPT